MSSRFNYFQKNSIKVNGVIHVGAHRGEEVGEYEDLGAKKVIWVEANPDVFEEMRVNLENSNASLESCAFQYAASNVDHKIVDFHLYYGPDAQYMKGNKGCSSLLKTSGRFSSWYKGTIQVETITLDTLLLENDLQYSDFEYLNMDVQGAEMMVLQGANKLLESVRYVSTEATWNNPDYIDNSEYDVLKSLLESKGFVQVEIYQHATNWGDVLFIKE
jgi:FkbM family methyltransferase